MYAVNGSHIHIVYLIENILSLSTCIYARYADGRIPIVVHCVDSFYAVCDCLILFVQLMFQFYKSLFRHVPAPFGHRVPVPLFAAPFGLAQSSFAKSLIPLGHHHLVVIVIIVGQPLCFVQLPSPLFLCSVNYSLL